MAQIDTNDSPQYTNSPYDQNQTSSPLSEIRHGGMYSVSFTDGHAKAWKMKPYTFDGTAGDFELMPADGANVLQFCYNPDATIEPNTSSFNPESTLSCRDTVSAMLSIRKPYPGYNGQ